MESPLIKIEEKLKDQVNHVCRFHEYSELKHKMFDLCFEWYIKGLHAGTEAERNQGIKVFLLFNIHHGSFEGVYAQRKDAEYMMESFGRDKNKFAVEEHEVIV
jgi:hypothetical protein